jgi:hypothetical protein
MTPVIAAGMGASIGVCVPGKNRWIGKAMFTANHESPEVREIDGDCAALIASRLAHTIDRIPLCASLLAIGATRFQNLTDQLAA